MSLENLVGISLEKVEPRAEQLARLLAAAQRDIDDAQIEALSNENRFDIAYKAVLQTAMAALHANGYCTPTHKPGHHQTAIQTLVTSVGLAPEKVVVLDELRQQRNREDYSGELVADGAAQHCLRHARELLDHVRAWLAKHKPQLGAAAEAAG